MTARFINNKSQNELITIIILWLMRSWFTTKRCRLQVVCFMFATIMIQTRRRYVWRGEILQQSSQSACSLGKFHYSVCGGKLCSKSTKCVQFWKVSLKKLVTCLKPLSAVINFAEALAQQGGLCYNSLQRPIIGYFLHFGTSITIAYSSHYVKSSGLNAKAMLHYTNIKPLKSVSVNLPFLYNHKCFGKTLGNGRQ